MNNEIPNTISNRKFWQKLFNKWKYVLQLYIDKVKDDLPYWHRERANTGFLAEACWKTGAVVVEEYWTQRKGRRGKGKVGSCDLFVKHKDLNFSVEAKQLWPPVPEDERNIEHIEDSLDEAYKQLVDNRYARKCQYLVAICYISPMLKRKFDSKLYLRKLRERYKKEIIIPFFPRINPKRIVGNDEYKYPGIVLIAKVHKRK